MNPKISIIVPIYNVADYMERCISSLVSQTIKDIQIIAVNDGSTDSSLEIIQEFALKDKRIQVIDKENGGVSSARNIGLQHASGEFIGFVDPDDWVDEGMYAEMYNTAQQDNADIVMCSYIREFGTHSKEKEFPLPAKIKYTNDEVQEKIMRRIIGPLDEEIANPEMLDAWGTVWSKLYRTDLIKKNELFFTDLATIGTNEDSLFNIHATYHAEVFIFINKPFYHYWRQNTGSITSGYKPGLIDKWCVLFYKIESFLKEKNLDSKYFRALSNRISINTLGLGLNELSKSNNSTSKQKLKNLSYIVNHQLILKSFQQLELKHFPFLWKIFYYCAKNKKTISLFFMLSSIEWLRKAVR